MTTREGFFQAIRKDPDDVAVRLIFADWLEEQDNDLDQARAELIRRQCRLAELAPDKTEWAEQYSHVHRLWQAHRRDWNGPLHEYLHRGGLRHAVSSRRGLIKPWDYRRGFVEALHLQAMTLYNHSRLVMQLGPIRHLKLWSAKHLLRDLLSCPALAQVSTLDLEGNWLSTDDAHLMATSGHLKNLDNLYLPDNPIGPQGQEALQEALPETRVHYHLGDSTIFPPARGPFVPH